MSQKTLVQTRGAKVEKKVEEPVTDYVSLADQYVELRDEAEELERAIRADTAPFEEEMQELKRKMDAAANDHREKMGQIQMEMASIERAFSAGCVAGESCMYAGKHHTVQVTKSFRRSVNAGKLHSLLDREGLLGHYGYLFSFTAKVGELDAAMKAPVFPKEAEECIERKEQGARFKVVV